MLGAVAALALAACQPSGPVAASTLAQSGLAQVPLTVTAANGTHRFVVEVARTPAEQQRGLMFRRALGPDRGMIFPFATPEQATFWMKDTLIPLDLLFIRADGSIVNIAADAKPMDVSLLPSNGLVSAVLELAGGRAAQLGFRPGDRVAWPH